MMILRVFIALIIAMSIGVMTPAAASEADQRKFAQLLAKLEKDPAAMAAFQKNPVAVLKAEGIATPPTLKGVNTKATRTTATTNSARSTRAFSGVVVGKHWWGLDIIMTEPATQKLIDGATSTSTLGEFMAAALDAANVVSGGVAGVVGSGLALIVEAKVAQVKLVNKGRGVHFPISWVQWGLLASSTATGPSGVLATGVVFVHPAAN